MSTKEKEIKREKEKEKARQTERERDRDRKRGSCNLNPVKFILKHANLAYGVLLSAVIQTSFRKRIKQL